MFFHSQGTEGRGARAESRVLEGAARTVRVKRSIMASALVHLLTRNFFMHCRVRDGCAYFIFRVRSCLGQAPGETYNAVPEHTGTGASA